MEAVEDGVVPGVDHGHDLARVDHLDQPPQEPRRADAATQGCD
jgi:hypothetical protein